MRFFCRYKGQEAEYIKGLFKEAGIGMPGGPSVRQFTKSAITKELKHLAAMLLEHQQKVKEEASGEEVETETEEAPSDE